MPGTVGTRNTVRMRNGGTGAPPCGGWNERTRRPATGGRGAGTWAAVRTLRRDQRPGGRGRVRQLRRPAGGLRCPGRLIRDGRGRHAGGACPAGWHGRRPSAHATAVSSSRSNHPTTQPRDSNVFHQTNHDPAAAGAGSDRDNPRASPAHCSRRGTNRARHIDAPAVHPARNAIKTGNPDAPTAPLHSDSCDSGE